MRLPTPILQKIKDCEGCKERREKMRAATEALVNWIKSPRSAPPPFVGAPKPPLRVRGRNPNR